MFYGYSISYFFLLIQDEKSQMFNRVMTVFFALLNWAILGTSIFGFIAVSGSQCSGAAQGYGPVLWFLNVAGVLTSLIVLILAHYLFFSFRSTGKLPIFGGEFGD